MSKPGATPALLTCLMHPCPCVHVHAAGQCNDGLFRLAAEGRLDVLVGQVDRLEAKDVGKAAG